MRKRGAGPAVDQAAVDAAYALARARVGGPTSAAIAGIPGGETARRSPADIGAPVLPPANEASATNQLGDFDLNIPGLGASFPEGMVAGIDANSGAVADASRRVAMAGLNAAADATGSHSPSLRFAELGEDNAAGYALGMLRGVPPVLTASSRLADAAMQGASRKVGGVGGGAPITIQLSVNIDAKGATSEDAEHIAQVSADALPAALVRVFDMLASQYGQE